MGFAELYTKWTIAQGIKRYTIKNEFKKTI